MTTCPCGSGRPIGECCQPYISGSAKPPTAEALMRSRYTAYVTQAVDYIVKTCTPRSVKGLDVEPTRIWSTTSQWHGLTIVQTANGGPDDTEGMVEFVASYTQDGRKQECHERSHFEKIDGQWLYDTGRTVSMPTVRTTPKVGRNDPCTCGSGKKFKQCCGKG